MLQILSSEEQLKAEQYYSDLDREGFITRQGILRMISSLYVGAPPSELRFYYGRNNKPFLAGSHTDGTLSFNMSHSNGLALYAFTRSGSLGLDIEFAGFHRDFKMIAEEFFTAGEYEWIRSLPWDKQEKGFLNIWTLKEAYLKALEEGLGGLEQVEILFDQSGPAALLDMRKETGQSHWSLYQMLPSEGYVSALVTKKNAGRLKLFSFIA